MRKKKLIVGLLIASFLVSIINVNTSEVFFASKAEEKKKEAESDLKEVNKEITNIKNKQNALEKELKNAKAQLAKLFKQQEALEQDIATTQEDIEQTKLELEKAREEEQTQYELMVLRIQFMYENSSSNDMLAAILDSGSIAESLNRIEYINTIQNADRTLLDQYKEIVVAVEAKEDELLEKMDELLMKQEAFLGQQMEIEYMLADLEDAKKEYAMQIAAAEKKANEYKQTIKEQEAIIKQEEDRKQQASSSNKDYDNSQQGNRNVSGEELVRFAKQFVGNPYVWGGNSLTNGCDCSGFVHLVYKNFGYKTVRYSMSFLYEGKVVDPSDMKLGDIIVYERINGIGHVGIYAGNGKVVEAQSSKAGITANRAWNCRKVVGIRRILPNP